MSLLPSRDIPDTALKALGGVAPLPSGSRGTVASGWNVVESGDGTRRRVVLSVTTPLSVVTTPDAETLADGVLAYTFPAGVIIVHEVYGDVGLEINDAANVGDTPEAGLGFTIAAGVQATLGAAAAGIEAENIWGPQVMTGCDVGAAPTDAVQAMSTPNLIIPGATAHTVFFNLAAVWGNGAGTADLFLQAARFVIDFTLLPTEGL